MTARELSAAGRPARPAVPAPPSEADQADLSGKPTSYQAELARIEKDIAALRDVAFADPSDAGRVTRYAYAVYQRAVLAGDLVALERTEPILEQAARRLRLPADVHFLQASLAFKLHRLADVKRALALPSLAASVEAKALQADLDFQEGRYAQARERYLGLIGENRTWDNLARLAHFEFKMGDSAAADELFAEAEDELTAKEMRSYAWVELQRGLLDFAHGCHDAALAHYRRADRAYSGYWLVADHIAECLGAQGRFREAAALYEDVVACAPKPELQQALGDVYANLGEQGRAHGWYETALAAYLESVERGGVHYYHHLADFHADVMKDGAEAVKWARKDLELRENFASLAALAWALHRNGEAIEAVERMRQALSSGARSAHLFSQAARIHHAAGLGQDGERYARMATEINPHHHAFHVHR